MFGKSVIGQAIFRALNGMALGSILPLSQTLLVEMVDVSMRGRAFGFMSLCEKLSGTLAAASIVYLDPNWEYPYWGLGVGSIVMQFGGALLARNFQRKSRPAGRASLCAAHTVFAFATTPL